MSRIEIRESRPDDREWVRTVTEKLWGAASVVVHGTVFHPHLLPGFLAVSEAERVGVITYRTEPGAVEVMSLASLHGNLGVGTALVEAVLELAAREGCARVWTVTTNDNLRALGFYQKRGFRIVSVDAGAVERARKQKPEIPRVGEEGIPIRDEIELELGLGLRDRRDTE